MQADVDDFEDVEEQFDSSRCEHVQRSSTVKLHEQIARETRCS
jgi:hypothetical protein